MHIIYDESRGILPALKNAVKQICDVLPSLQLVSKVNTCKYGTAYNAIKPAAAYYTAGSTSVQDPFKKMPNYAYLNGSNIVVNEGKVIFPLCTGTNEFKYSRLELTTEDILNNLNETNINACILRTVTFDKYSDGGNAQFTWDTVVCREEYKQVYETDSTWSYELCSFYFGSTTENNLYIAVFTSEYTGGTIEITNRIGV